MINHGMELGTIGYLFSFCQIHAVLSLKKDTYSIELVRLHQDHCLCHRFSLMLLAI